MIASRCRITIWAGLTAAGCLLLGPTATADVRGPEGTAVVIDGETAEPIAGGSSQTAFSVALPSGAACPGDSLNNYRVQSFLVPEAVDPGTLIYQGVRPGERDGSARYWALYEVNSNTYMNRPTDIADREGGEGTIINIPSFDYAVFDPGMVPTGRAHLGVACSLFGETVRYWSTLIDVTAEADDPAGIAWTVVDPPAASESEDGSSGGIVAAVAGAVVIGGAVVVRRRSRNAGQVTQ